MTTRNIRLPRTVIFNIAFVGLISIACRGTAQTVAEKTSMPAAVFGPWVADCAVDLPVRIDFVTSGAEVVSRSGPTTCHVTGVRSLSDVRWYVDLECKDGSLLQLDLYLTGRNRLLVARRPLGEACSYNKR
jgi:hypothetical protein